MKILIIGKNNIMKWPQSTYNALRTISDSAELFLCNKRTIRYCLMHLFGKKIRKRWLAKKFEQRIRAYQPDIILFVAAFLIPPDFFKVLKKFPHIIKVGWCGDKFTTEKAPYANSLDFLFCTDCGFLETAQHFTCQSYYLPLCANQIFEYSNKKSLPPFFACGLNAERRKYLSAIRTKCLLYIKNCPKNALPQHDVRYHTISHDKMLQLINKSICPINIGLSVNNMTGLNFRVFETGAAGGLIMVNKECTDISKCYSVGKEAVTYSTPEELNDLIADVVAHPQNYNQIAQAGYDRTIKEHTFTARMRQMIKIIQENKNRS